jgi:hypothetical protein
MKKIGFSFGSFVKIGLIAMVFILLAKWVLTKVNVPGLSSAVQGV